MKKLFLCIVASLVCFDAYATTPYAALMRSGGHREYLAVAANAWSSVAGSSIGIGRHVPITSRLGETFATDTIAFQDLLAVLAYNESPLTVFEVRQHISSAFAPISGPLASRRTDAENFIVEGNFQFGMSEFESDENGDFKTNNTGLHINARGYISDGWALGIGYTRIDTDTDDKRIYTDGVSNSVTAFFEYLSRGGMFVNGGVNIGRINWSSDKIVSGISDSSDYDTDFYAAQLTTGVKLGHDSFFIIPQVGARYMYAVSEKHTDEAVQSFGEWKYGSFNAIADLKLGTRFAVSPDFSFSPNLLFGGSYSLFGNTDDFIHATLVNGAAYDIPVETGSRAALHAGIGVLMDGPSFGIELSYKLNYRQDYTAHTGFVKLKLMF